MQTFFKLRENNTNISREVVAGLTTFFAMSYIIFVQPAILSQTGMPSGGIFLATIFASVIGTLVMGLFANVPYAQAPGMGLNTFFTYTVCFGLNFTWQEALAMVFICGLINILITATKLRKLLIQAIPTSLQSAIGGGIGLFVAYIGLKGCGLLNFIVDPGNYTFNVPSDPTLGLLANASTVPTLVKLNTPSVLVSLFAIAVLAILLVKKVKGAVLASIIGVTLIGIPFGITNLSGLNFAEGISKAFAELSVTFGAAFGPEGMGSLFADQSRWLTVLMTIFAFSLSDTFDTIGTFIGTGRHTGIFKFDDEKEFEKTSGFSTKLDRALFADAIATSMGAVLGTSNTTTYVESSAGIEAGGRTGLTSVVTALCFLLCIPFASFVAVVPAIATAPVLLIVGILMMSSLRDVNFSDLEESIPAFFATLFMTVAYNITYGIAFAFISYILIKLAVGKSKDIHPVLWFVSSLFVLNFIIMGIF